MDKKADIGFIGLGVMGQNLILNTERNGYKVACYNRTTSKMDAFIEGEARGKNIVGCKTLEELVGCLSKPGKIMMMIPAGKAVEQTIKLLKPLLDEGDILIDGGNSYFLDTQRRCLDCKKSNILYAGVGISGGEEGALNGPAIMPGGNPDAWPEIKKIFQDIAAHLEDGTPCCQWMGLDGAGHFVKMVHNGIEYGDMQLICEAYHLMSDSLKLTREEIAEIFARWNKGILSSYLIEITAEILKKIDSESKKPVVDIILDTAGQKGTGSWTAKIALDMGIAVPQIAESVYARSMSVIKEERVEAAKILPRPVISAEIDKKNFINKLEKAVYAAKISSYAQGFHLLRKASNAYGWKLNYANIAQVWQGGCIIRADFLADIKAAFEHNSELKNLLLASEFAEALSAQSQKAWRDVLKIAIDTGVPVPSMSSALNYFDSYRTARLPANLLQAQRDFFGAHTYERVDKPRGDFFHTEW
ncbi:MAG: decarboxylating NADP(+)-dependent phosphogluconate dehydrogenase [Candidatus Rifleibacteriota bacterium]